MWVECSEIVSTLLMICIQESQLHETSDKLLAMWSGATLGIPEWCLWKVNLL